MKSKITKKISSFLIVVLLIGMSFLSLSVYAKNFKNNFSEEDMYLQFDIDDEINTLIEKANLPSISAGIVKNDSLVWYGGYGKHNKLLGLTPSNNTVYMAGSISKAIATMALMQLYEDGLFELDDDISDYLPFPLRNPYHPEVPITFKMLLSHQSSLPLTDINQSLYVMMGYLLNLPKLTYPNFIEYLVPGGKAYNKDAWTDNKPGDAFNYSNVGFMLIEYIFEEISGQDFQKYCKENIFNRLKMYNTSYNIRDFKRVNRAVPYTQIGKLIVRLPFYKLPTPGAGGLITSIEDLSHFLIAHMNNGTYDGVRVLNDSTIKLIHKLHYYHELNEIYNFQYGLGWMLINKSGTIYQGHHGSTFGYQSRMLYRESDRAGVIFFVNKFPGAIYFKNQVSLNEALSQIMDLLFLKSEEL